ncbi:MAG: F-type H+-transporting ATPase subunit b [Candidatus Electronema aureum]|uniref:ATP synthase subunit b n=1 Tax=Candidatus Electronema aureum TaxID=2005002 RepID=A0A521G3L9_9BACT|nr:MAG: F-type H+-transporting ATPase subunit b [Candidatus Electronema aureum]
MKVKKVLPLLAATWLCVGAAGAVFAEEHGAAASHEQAAVQDAHQIDHAAEASVGHDAHAGGEEGHGESHAAPMITGEKLKDLLWRTLNFAALVFLLVKFAGKPIVEGLGSRRKAIEDDLQELQAKRNEAERSYKDFEARLAGMEQEFELIVGRAVALAQDERSRILAEAESSARDIRRQAEAAVEAAAAAARSSLQDEVAEQAAAMAEHLILKNLTPADQVMIIEQYLERATQ